MTDIDQILNRIRVGMARHGRKKQIAEETGIHPVVLSRLAKPDSNPTADQIRRLDAAVIKLFSADQPNTLHQPE
jgi:DNA-binding phage protein